MGRERWSARCYRIPQLMGGPSFGFGRFIAAMGRIRPGEAKELRIRFRPRAVTRIATGDPAFAARAGFAP